MEQSRQFRRVSTDEQDTAKQIADLDRWDSGHGYEPGPAYVVDGKSAYHGKQRVELDRALAEMAQGDYTVLVIWAADRMWRQESSAEAIRLIEAAENAGGRVEFVKDSYLNMNPDLPKWVRDQMLVMAFGMAHAESDRKSQRSVMDKEYKRKIGAADNRPPWGYDIVCQVCASITRRENGRTVKCGHKDSKLFVPSSLGRRWVPVVFEMIIEGKSGREVAELLTQQGVPTAMGKAVWNYSRIKHVINNPAYRGVRRNGGNLEIEALVSPTTWQEANAALTARGTRGRGASVHADPLLRPFCGECWGVEREGCQTGKSPMYRIIVGDKDHRRAYYRCAGSGPARKTCGAPMIPVELLDNHVTFILGRDRTPHVERKFVAGDDHADQIETLRLKLDQAKTRTESNELWDQIEALEMTEAVPAHWMEIETGISSGKYFRSLDAEGQREYLGDFRPVVSIEDGEIVLAQDSFLWERSTNFSMALDAELGVHES